jgi:uncharacterized protein
MLCTTFKTAEHSYIYTAWTNQVARAPEALWRLFAEGEETESDAERRLAKGVELGLLPESRLPLEVFREGRIQEALDELAQEGPETLILTLTEQCNFRCRYCQFSGAYRNSRLHSAASMSEAVALQALEWCSGFERDKRHIGFYGGEPLLRFPLLQSVTSRAQELLNGDTSFGLTTNGGLLTPEIGDYLAERRFHLFVSLDGPAEVHDRYRIDAAGKPTFELVWTNLRALRERHPDYYQDYVGFNVTTAPPDPLPRVRAFLDENPGMFNHKIISFSNLKQDPSTVLETLGVEESDARVEYDWAWESFLDACVKGEQPPDMTRKICEPPMARIHQREMGPQAALVTDGGQCAPGQRCHVTPDGRLHMCEHIDGGFPLGTVQDGYDRDVIAGYLRDFGALMEERCQDCWAVRLCSKCIPVLADGARLSRARLAEVCAKTKRLLKRDLAHYCASRDKNPNCFDWITDKKYDINL